MEQNLFIVCREEGFDTEPIEKYGLTEIDADIPLLVEIVFMDGEGIRSLNRETRGKDAVTDVLSYPNLENPGEVIRAEDYPYDVDEEGKLFLGSIVICRERAAEQAEEYGHSLRRELYYLAVHGLCHLLGYDHETDGDRKRMREREEKILSAMGVVRED